MPLKALLWVQEVEPLFQQVSSFVYSGLAVKDGIDVGAGVIDPDYRGAVGVVLFNHSDTEFYVKKGDRIAQLILEKASTPDVIEIKDLDQTQRGEGGFGSSGV